MKDLMKDSNFETSKFSQIMFDGLSAVSTAVSQNLFLNKYFQLQYSLHLHNSHLAFLISQASSKTTKAYM